MKHPPYSSSELDILYPGRNYNDIYHNFPIGEVTRYWTKLLIDNGIRLEKSLKTSPWSVNIIHMHSPTMPNLYTKDCYKINFNLECRDVIIDDGQECEVTITKKDGVSIRHTGTIGYRLDKKERDFTENLFKGEWVDYLDIQGSRIIVQFWLEDYYPIFRKEKILKIKNNILSL